MMEDKESWLATMVEKEGDSSCDTEGLLATAALVRGAVNAPEVPENVQSQARARGLQELPQIPGRPEASSQPSPTWLGRLGSVIQVAFNLIKRR